MNFSVLALTRTIYLSKSPLFAPVGYSNPRGKFSLEKSRFSRFGASALYTTSQLNLRVAYSEFNRFSERAITVMNNNELSGKYWIGKRQVINNYLIVTNCKFSLCHSEKAGGALVFGGTNPKTSVQLKNSLFHTCWSDTNAGAYSVGGQATEDGANWNPDSNLEGPDLEGLCLVNCYSTKANDAYHGSAGCAVSNKQKARYITALNCGKDQGEDMTVIQWGVNGIEAHDMNYTSTESRNEIPFAWMYIGANAETGRPTQIKYISVTGVTAKAMIGGFSQGQGMLFECCNIYKCTVPSHGGIFKVGGSGVTTTISNCNIYQCGKDYNLIIAWGNLHTYNVANCKSDISKSKDSYTFTTPEYVPHVPAGPLDFVSICSLPFTDPFTASVEFSPSAKFTPSNVFTSSATFTASNKFTASAYFTASSSFTASSGFTASAHFTASSGFTKSSAFTSSRSFTPSAPFTESGAFTLTSKFTQTQVFSSSSEFSPTLRWDYTKTFSPSATFTPSGVFTASGGFTETSGFTATEIFTASTTFSPSNKFTPSTTFSPSNKFTPSTTLVQPTPGQAKNIANSPTGIGAGAIAGISVGIALLIVIIVIIVMYIVKKKGKQAVENSGESSDEIFIEDETVMTDHNAITQPLPDDDDALFEMEMSDE